MILRAEQGLDGRATQQLETVEGLDGRAYTVAEAVETLLEVLRHVTRLRAQHGWHNAASTVALGHTQSGPAM